MQVWNVLHAARCKCRTQRSRQKIAIWAPSHNFVGHIFATRARIDNWKNLLSNNISSTRPHNMVNLCPPTAEIGSVIWGTPALLHGTLVVGVSQTLRRWTEGATYIRQGGHHVGHWPTFLVYLFIYVTYYCDVCFTILCRRQNTASTRRFIKTVQKAERKTTNSQKVNPVDLHRSL